MECIQSKLDNIFIFLKFILPKELRNVSIVSGSNKNYEVKQGIEERHGACIHVCVHVCVCVNSYLK